jgi:Dolichyl-phosphate-mannose-protein mannosyltransferase
MGSVENCTEAAAAPPAPVSPEVSGPTRRPRVVLARRAWSWLKSRRQDVLVIGALLALCVLVKVLWLRPIDMYWDAGAKWHFVRQWSYANDFSHAQWSHHMARFGVHVPTYVVQLLFGTSSRVYYVTPIAIFSLGMVFAYLTASRLGGRAAGVLAALFMIFHPDMNRGATQLLPDGMIGTAALMAGYAFVRFHEEQDGAKRRWWLFGIAGACLWAYAIKESSVLLFPGVALAVFFSRRSYKEAALLCGALALYGVLETASFSLFTPYTHRLAVVQEKHGLYPPITFWGMFGRFAKLEPANQALFWLWTASVVYDAGREDKRRRLLLLLPLGYVFFVTFMVRRIDPLSQWLSFKPRYMWPAVPLFMTSVAVFLTECIRRVWSLHRRPRLESWRQGLVERPGLAICSLCAVLGFGTYLSERKDLDSHPLVTLPHDASILNDALRRNLPIVERAENPRALNTMVAVYMRPAYLAQSDLARGGRLPDIQEAIRFFGKGKKRRAYVLRDQSAYRDGELQALIADGCAISVAAKGGLRVDPSERLPERCKAPRGEPLPKAGPGGLL